MLDLDEERSVFEIVSFQSAKNEITSPEVVFKKGSYFKLRHHLTGLYVSCELDNWERWHYQKFDRIEIKRAYLEQKSIYFRYFYLFIIYLII